MAGKQQQQKKMSFNCTFCCQMPLNSKSAMKEENGEEASHINLSDYIKIPTYKLASLWVR